MDEDDGPEPESDGEVDEENLTPRTRVLLRKANAKYMEALGLNVDGTEKQKEEEKGGDDSDSDGNVDDILRRQARAERLRKQAEEEAERLSKVVMDRVPLPRGEKEHPLDPTPIRVKRRKGKRGADAASGAGVGAPESSAASGTVEGAVMRRGVLGAAVAHKTQPPAIVLRGWRSSQSGSDGEL